MDTVTDEAAEYIAQAIGDQYGATGTGQYDRPRVFPGSHEELSDDARVIVWEGGDAPYQWPTVWSQTWQARELGKQHGVWFEPVHGCAVAVLPAEQEA